MSALKRKEASENEEQIADIDKRILEAAVEKAAKEFDLDDKNYTVTFFKRAKRNITLSLANYNYILTVVFNEEKMLEIIESVLGEKYED